ncbi:M4 family metallopeptidase [Streptomyces sp. NPDC090106]|uniref:M4 family metallopeptidase n=1 Tax=Streptomyces sp. NPDC090106 TaxID=3365946 RepID=UPI0038290DEA
MLFLRRGWYMACLALAAALAGLVSALAAVQGALRVVAAHSNTYFDVLVAKYLDPDLSGTVGGLVAGTGVPVQWHMSPFNGHITAQWVVEQRSELVLIAAGPVVGAAVVGWVVAAGARRLALPKWPLLVAASGAFAVLASAAQIATRDTHAVMALSASARLTVLASASWALLIGGAVVRFLPAGAARPRQQAVRARRHTERAVAVGAAVVTVASLMSAGAAVARPQDEAGGHQGKWHRPGVNDALKSLKDEPGTKLRSVDDPRTGVPANLAGLRSTLPAKGVAGWLDDHAKVFGVTGTDGILTPKKADERLQVPDPTGARHFWYNQELGGVPVYGAEIGVHVDKAGKEVTAVSNALRPDLVAPASTTPKLSRAAAVKKAGDAVPDAEKPARAPELVVYAGTAQPGVDAKAVLAWQVDLSSRSGTAERIFVDALGSKGIVGTEPRSETALNRTIIDAQHTSNNGKTVRVEGGPETGDRDADRAYSQTGVVYTHFRDRYGRDSIDGAGMPLVAEVHVGQKWVNAQWDLNAHKMEYGDGMLSQDVTGHEMMHGITEATAALPYSFQTGALNESISDFFGEMAERSRNAREPDWLVGSELDVSGPFRDMIHPEDHGQPNSMSQYVLKCGDYGGVHTNSGIINKALWNMANKIGTDYAEDVLWRAVTVYMTTGTRFAQAAQVMVEASADLYGLYHPRTASVHAAFREVGIDTDTRDPRPPGCSGGATTNCLTVDTISANAGALAPGGAGLNEVIGSLIHTYNVSTITSSPAISYYSNLYLENRDTFEKNLAIEGDLLDQFTKTVQVWHPVLDSIGTGEGDTVVITQEQIDSANALADQTVIAAEAQGIPTFAKLVTRERQRFVAQETVGLTVNQAIAYLDGTVPPAQPETPAPAATSLAATFNNVSVTQDGASAAGSVDGAGNSYSAQALQAAGVTPGSSIAHGGVALTWPATAGTGKADNTVANGQTIAVTGSGDTLGFLVSATAGAASGQGKVYYDDGTVQTFDLGSPNWTDTTSEAAVTTAYQNTADNGSRQLPGTVHYAGVKLQSGRTPVSVKLPQISEQPTPDTPALHVYAMGLGNIAQSLTDAFNNVAVTHDTATQYGDVDGWGSSFSAEALAAAGASPGGKVSRNGLVFTWPATAGATSTLGTYTVGALDNALASGQTIAVDGTRGGTLGFLVASAYGPASGTATIRYSDGTSQQFTLNGPDWFNTSGDVAVKSAYQNRQNNQKYAQPGYIHYVGVTLQSGKTPVSVTLPDISKVLAADVPALHVFAMTRG